MMWVVWSSVIVLILVTYVSAVALALLLVSRVGLDQRLEDSDRHGWIEWLTEHEVATRQSMALLRMVLRLTFFVLILLQVVELKTDAPLTLPILLIAGGATLALLWVFSVVLAGALARHAAEAIVSGALPILRVVTTLCLPFTRSLGFVDEAVRRLTGANLRQPEEEAEAELLRNIEETQREGALDPQAATMLENVVELGDTDVAEVMTPRTDIEGIELTNDLTEIRAFIVKAGHSRFPVFEENVDHIVGILYVKDLVPYLGEDASNFQLRPLLRQPIVVPETKSVGEMLADFQRSEVHLAVVIDEYGGTAGLATIEDVLEEIVGEIHDEHEPEDEIEPTLTRIDDTHAEADGRFHIDDLNDQLGLELPENDDFDTIAGFVLATLGRVPETGESFGSHDVRFKVLRATATQVERVEIEFPESRTVNGGT